MMIASAKQVRFSNDNVELNYQYFLHATTISNTTFGYASAENNLT